MSESQLHAEGRGQMPACAPRSEASTAQTVCRRAVRIRRALGEAIRLTALSSAAKDKDNRHQIVAITWSAAARG